MGYLDLVLEDGTYKVFLLYKIKAIRKLTWIKYIKIYDKQEK